jgi:hypothetical protein
MQQAGRSGPKGVGTSQGGVGPVARDSRAVLGQSWDPHRRGNFCMPSPSPHRGRTSGQQPIAARDGARGRGTKPRAAQGGQKGGGGGANCIGFARDGALVELWWSFGGACMAQRHAAEAALPAPSQQGHHHPSGSTKAFQKEWGLRANFLQRAALTGWRRLAQTRADSRRQVLVGVM